jgi:hypothetical protein
LMDGRRNRSCDPSELVASASCLLSASPIDLTTFR